MTKFAYNNAKHASKRYTPFELNFGYYVCIFDKEDVDILSKFKVANELTK